MLALAEKTAAELAADDKTVGESTSVEGAGGGAAEGGGVSVLLSPSSGGADVNAGASGSGSGTGSGGSGCGDIPSSQGFGTGTTSTNNYESATTTGSDYGSTSAPWLPFEIEVAVYRAPGSGTGSLYRSSAAYQRTQVSITHTLIK